jgi:nucleoside-diphosphate-sugar epimerase
MEPNIKSILVFGASSPTGQYIVQEALKNNWAVKTYDRSTLAEHTGNPYIKVSYPPLDSLLAFLPLPDKQDHPD